MDIRFHSMMKHKSELICDVDLKVENINDLLKAYAIDPGEIGVILINGKLADFKDRIEEDDQIDFYPIFGGG